MKRLIFFTLALSVIFMSSFTHALTSEVTTVKSDGYCVTVNHKIKMVTPVTPEVVSIVCNSRRVITPGPVFSAIPPCPFIPIDGPCGKFQDSGNLIKKLFCLPATIAKNCAATLDSCFDCNPSIISSEVIR